VEGVLGWAVRVTVTLSVLDERFTISVSFWPGGCAAITATSALGPWMGVPSIAVIRSPGCSPPLAAGLPAATLSTSAPGWPMIDCPDAAPR
jgi:hypothetical protein